MMYISTGVSLCNKQPIKIKTDTCSMIFQFSIRTLRPEQGGHHFADNIFKCIFLNENVWILIKISLKFIPKGLINNIPTLVQIMAWRRPGGKPLSELILISLLRHICITQPQWVKYRKTSNISRTFVGNKIVDNSDVVGASPVGAAPTTSSFST